MLSLGLENTLVAYIVPVSADICSAEIQTAYKLGNSLKYIHRRNQSYFVGHFF